MFCSPQWLVENFAVVPLLKRSPFPFSLRMYKLPGILGVICQALTLGQWNQLENSTSLTVKTVSILCYLSVPYNSALRNIRQGTMVLYVAVPFGLLSVVLSSVRPL